MNIYEVVQKLTGPVDPVGDSGVDEGRLENLKTLCNLADLLIADIVLVANAQGDHIGSIKEAKGYACKWLERIE